MKIDYQFPGGPVVRAEASKAGVVVFLKSLGGRRGHCVTLAATGEVIAWRRTVKEARTLQKKLEAGIPDWGEEGAQEKALAIIAEKETRHETPAQNSIPDAAGPGPDGGR